jgi:hypothetical protein
LLAAGADINSHNPEDEDSTPLHVLAANTRAALFVPWPEKFTEALCGPSPPQVRLDGCCSTAGMHGPHQLFLRRLQPPCLLSYRWELSFCNRTSSMMQVHPHTCMNSDMLTSRDQAAYMCSNKPPNHRAGLLGMLNLYYMAVSNSCHQAAST